MNVLEFDPQRWIRQICLVGCGGTGSQLARITARLVYALKQGGRSAPQLTFVDPDVIEAKNVGRQLFVPQEVGRPKAQVLARRFNFALGLEIEALVAPFDGRAHLHEPRSTLLLGAVDNDRARLSLSQAGAGIWLDAGNSAHSGQVILGSTSDRERVLAELERVETRGGRKLYHLPDAGLLFPELLQPEQVEADAVPLSCAERALREEQSLLVNGQMALIAGEYLRKLLYREPITTFMTVYAGSILTVQSKPCTAAVLRACLET